MSDLISREKTLYRLATSAVYYFDLEEDKAAHDWAMHIVSGMPDEEPDIVRCKDCRHGVDYYHDGDCYCSNPKWGLNYFGGSWKFYCADAERRADE